MGTTEDKRELLSNVLLPVAHEADAQESAQALAPYDPERVTALHVVEKGGGVPDKTPVSYSEEMAENAYAAVHEVFPEAETHTAYGTNVVETIFDVVEDVDASAIAFRTRGGGRLLHFLSGDLALKLVTNAPVPVIALPRE